MPKLNTKPCRACDAPLHPSQHRKFTPIPTVTLPGAHNFWAGDFWFDHTECPHCGEEHPHLLFSDLCSFWVLAPAAALAFCGGWWVYHGAGAFHYHVGAYAVLAVPLIIFPLVGLVLWSLARLLDDYVQM